jgi:hypothetical protein
MQRFSIGRTPNCDIFINDSSVSKMHAEIIVNNNQATVRDLGSTNGTFINGLRLFGPQPLNQYDILKVGNSLVPWKNYVNMTDSNSSSNFSQQVQSVFSGESETPTVKEWMINLFLVAIPFVGFIMLIIWANQDNRLKKNFAQAQLWLYLIYFCVSIFFYFVLFLFIFRFNPYFWLNRWW